MKKLKKFLSASKCNAVLFVLIVSLVLSATVGAAYAAVGYISTTYSGQVQMYDIGVTILENGDRVSWRDHVSGRDEDTWDEHIPGKLLVNMLGEGEKLSYGKVYKEELSIRNSGNINTWLRVNIYRYWIEPDSYNEKGEPIKRQDLSPELIDLHLVNLGSYWSEDEFARTAERTVLYYNRLLYTGAETPLFADTLMISGNVATKTETITAEDGTVQVIYSYDGAQFCLEVRADVIQQDNAEKAILSAWGRQVRISGENLYLV